jgi:DNA invertase Pin-like site-specific DNA recombinase
MNIGYARVSTEEQNLTLQTASLRAAGCETIHEDWGYSGSSLSRPGLEDALTQLKKGDTLVVWRLDRLGRSLVHLVHTINDLEKNGIHFRSLTESIDTTSSGGRLVFHIMAAMAEFERNLISERTRAGMKVAKDAGRQVGRPPLLTKEQKAEVLSALMQGVSKIVIAKRFGVSLRTVERMATSPPATGVFPVLDRV